MTRNDGRVPASAPVIVAGVDGTERSIPVLRWADEQAQVFEAWLVALTAYGTGLTDPPDSPDLAAAAEAALERCIDLALPPDRARAAMRWTDASGPVEALTQRRDWRERLVVIGGHHHALLRPLGSVTSRVVGHAPAPVAVVRPMTAIGRSGRVVVGVDGSPYSRRALQWAAHYAERTHAKLQAVLAWSPDDRPRRGRREPPAPAREIELERRLHDELARLAVHHRAPVDACLRRGEPAQVLREAAVDADLLVVGSHGENRHVGRLSGSVSQQLVQHCDAPLVVVTSPPIG